MTSDLLNFTSARYIRLRLQRIRTLNADLMTLSARDPRDIDPIVSRRVRQAARETGSSYELVWSHDPGSCDTFLITLLHSHIVHVAPIKSALLTCLNGFYWDRQQQFYVMLYYIIET